MAPRLDEESAKRAISSLIADLGKRTYYSDYEIEDFDMCISILTVRLDPVFANRTFDALSAELGKTTDRNTLRRVVKLLSAIAPRLDPAATKHAFGVLIGFLVKTTDHDVTVATVETIPDRVVEPTRRCHTTVRLIKIHHCF